MRRIWAQMTGQEPEPYWMAMLGITGICLLIYGFLWLGYVFGGPNG